MSLVITKVAGSMLPSSFYSSFCSPVVWNTIHSNVSCVLTLSNNSKWIICLIFGNVFLFFFSFFFSFLIQLATLVIYLREKHDYHGFIGVASSLELNGSKSIRWAELRVLADGPLLWLDVIASKPALIFLILDNGDTWSESNMLTY